MDAMTRKYSSILLVLFLFIAAILPHTVAGASPCSGPLARQNERCRNNISFFKRMFETGRRGTAATTTDLDDNWNQLNGFESKSESMDDYRYKLQLIRELIRDIEQYKL